MENETTKKTWEKPELIIISNAGMGENVIMVSHGDGGDEDPPPWTRP